MRFEVLTPAEVRVVRALGRALFPAGGALPSADDARVAEYIDRYLTWVPAQERALVRAMFAAFGAGIAVRPRTSRTAWIASWENSRLYTGRVLFQALRSVFTLAYYADPEVLRRMGVDDGTALLRRWQAERGHVDVALRVVANPVTGLHPTARPAPGTRPARKRNKTSAGVSP